MNKNTEQGFWDHLIKDSVKEYVDNYNSYMSDESSNITTQHLDELEKNIANFSIAKYGYQFIDGQYRQSFLDEIRFIIINYNIKFLDELCFLLRSDILLEDNYECTDPYVLYKFVSNHFMIVDNIIRQFN